MARCLNPVLLTVELKKDKNLTFTRKQVAKDEIIRDIHLENTKPATILAPCGKCYHCRLNRARDWTIRTIHEYSRPEFKNTLMYFITFTYDNNHIGDNSLDYRDVQLFMKKLRKIHKDDILKFLCVGEYGFKSGRKHFHMLIFGFKNKIKYGAVQKLWQYGNLDIDIVHSYSAISYLLKYAFKDYKVDKNDYLKEGRTPSMFRCSKSFGKEYAVKYLDDMMRDGYISHNRYKYRIPRFYRNIYYKLRLVDGWQEYEKSTQVIHYNIISDLNKLNLNFGYDYMDFTDKRNLKFYLDIIRPIWLELNDKLYDNYFRRFIEKV